MACSSIFPKWGDAIKITCGATCPFNALDMSTIEAYLGVVRFGYQLKESAMSVRSLMCSAFVVLFGVATVPEANFAEGSSGDSPKKYSRMIGPPPPPCSEGESGRDGKMGIPCFPRVYSDSLEEADNEA